VWVHASSLGCRRSNFRTQAIKQDSDLDDDDDDDDEKSKPEEEDTEDQMHEEDVIDDSLLAPVDEDYEMASSSFLRNPYTPLTFPESSPPAIPVTRTHPNNLVVESSTQGSADRGLQPSHRQPLTAGFAQHVVQSPNEDDNFEDTAPPPSQYTKVDPRTKPAPARIETVLSQCHLYFFLRSRR
jgi:hypothetical protein